MTDYPSDSDLARIEAWPADDLRGLFDFIGDQWAYPEMWGDIVLDADEGGYTIVQCSTGGWSGNESLIGALQANRAAWLLTWYSSRRSGHFGFRIPRQEG